MTITEPIERTYREVVQQRAEEYKKAAIKRVNERYIELTHNNSIPQGVLETKVARQLIRRLDLPISEEQIRNGVSMQMLYTAYGKPCQCKAGK